MAHWCLQGPNAQKLSLGLLLQSFGEELVGQKVMRKWPDYQIQWWTGEVEAFDASTKQHRSDQMLNPPFDAKDKR